MAILAKQPTLLALSSAFPSSDISSSEGLHKDYEPFVLDLSSRAVGSVLKVMNKESLGSLIMLSSPEYAGSTPDTHLVSHFQLRSNLWRKWLGGSNQGTAWVSPLGLAIDRLEAHPSETVLLNCTEGNASATVVLGLLPEGQGVQFLATHTCSTGGEQIRPWIEDLLSIEELRIEDIQCWGLHVDDLALASDLAKELKLQSYQMRATEFIRQQFGNCATATPFLLLEEILKKDRPQRGDYGVLVSYGSGGVFQGILVRF